MATGVPPKSGMKRGEVSVSLTYEGKKDVSTILSQSFNQYSLRIPIMVGEKTNFFWGIILMFCFTY